MLYANFLWWARYPYTYDPYGNLLNSAGSTTRLVSSTGTVTNPFRFAGQYTDPESGLIYLRARYYDPSTGQLLSRDALNAITGSPYGYAFDDPINLVDVSGQFGLPVDLNPIDAGHAVASKAGGVKDSFQTGQLPNGHCLIWASNCASNFDANVQALESTPVIGTVVQWDPFYGDFRDAIYQAEGEGCKVNWAQDAVSTGVAFLPGPRVTPIAKNAVRFTGDISLGVDVLKNENWINFVNGNAIQSGIQSTGFSPPSPCGCS